MSEILPQYDYPAAEHYEFPRSELEQADEELRLYPTPAEFRDNVEVLKAFYIKTPVMKRLKVHAWNAVVVPAQGAPNHRPARTFNAGFYDGALMATHMHYAPAGPGSRRAILAADNLVAIDPKNETEVEAVRSYLEGWAGKADYTWLDFYDSQNEYYQSQSLEMAERLYDGQPQAEELVQNFLIGYTFGTGAARMAIANGNWGNPV